MNMYTEENPYFEAVRPTYLENWPDGLRELSIPQVDIPLTLNEAAALGSNLMEYFETFDGPAAQDLSSIRLRLDEAIARFPGGAFVRLGSRSPKDSWLGHREGLRVTTAEKALRLLCDASERISDDLHLALACEYAPHLFVRQWIEIPCWAEFRCFSRDGELVGISQYDYHLGRREEIVSNGADIEKAIHRFFRESFSPRTHLSTVVFDVFLEATLSSVTLLEINPFDEYTDPCLFEQRTFEGQFLYCKEPASSIDYESMLQGQDNLPAPKG